MNEDQQKAWILERLRHSLQALALPALEQVSLFPDFVVKTDELVLDFDHWRRCAIDNHPGMTQPQSESLAVIDKHIDEPPSPAVWDESALRSHPFWEELRVLAAQSLAAFGWTLETPPNYAHEYVRGTRVK